ncbi:MAG TPA: Tm-1-like ATP-binding domain-containing protein [Acidimicrobiia bacterium]|nr:Tm-1-like ATP-binding domain-containing protein [Acidimicrobiia bacterium]
MAPQVVIVGTLDTKGPEVAYIRDRLIGLGCTTTVIDVGILGEPLGIVPDIDHGEVARFADSTIGEIRQAGTRGRAVAMMRRAVQSLMTDLYRRGQVDAAIGLGGAEGAVIGAAALMVLPIGVPKVVLSPIASGRHEFGPLVGTSDMMVVHTVVDIMGLNRVATTVFDNVVVAVAAMAANPRRLVTDDSDTRLVGVTMLGNTTKAVMALRDRLSEHGYEAVVFHSNGVGGPAMEDLATAGHFVGIVDFTTNEVTDPMVGGIHDGGPRRLRTIGELGLPQIVVPGCIDFSVFASGQVPPELADRPTYDHNPEYTLVRTPKAQMEEIGQLFAERLNLATGPIAIAIPTGGLSIPNVPDGVFWDPVADGAFVERLRRDLRPDIAIHKLAYHVNDPSFGEIVADLFVELLEDATVPMAQLERTT